MNLNQLIAYLKHHYQCSQPSERWAMYRLIAPVVDHANQSLGFVPYFEYNQTSAHGTHQSVDIALLDDQNQPNVLIEAKRAERNVSPEQIEKYLEYDVRGIVTNGFIWILCHQGKHEAITLFRDNLERASLERILHFIRGSAVLRGKLNHPDDVYVNPIRPQKSLKKESISRPTHPVTVCSSQEQLLDFISSNENRPHNESALLIAISEELTDDAITRFPRIETRKTRVSFFDDRQSGHKSRLARIELGKGQPDLLVRTWVVDQYPELSGIAQPTVHDKGAHMRRFRLSSADQAAAFGRTLVSVLSQVS